MRHARQGDGNGKLGDEVHGMPKGEFVIRVRNDVDGQTGDIIQNCRSWWGRGYTPASAFLPGAPSSTLGCSVCGGGCGEHPLSIAHLSVR